MSKQRRIQMSETRTGIHHIHQLKSWLDQIPAESSLLVLKTFDGEITVVWEELR